MRSYNSRNREKVAAQAKKRRLADPEGVKEAKRRHYLEHKTTILARNRERAAANAETTRERQRRYREKNRETLLAQKANYRKENAEAIKAGQHAYYRRNREKVKARVRAYRERNPEKVKASLHEAYQKHKPRIRKKMAEWQKRNPEKYKEIRRAARLNRVARKKKAEGRYTVHDVRRMLDSQGGLCNACPRNLADGYHVDHIMPLSRGGSNWPDNLQLLCPKCNCSKHNLTMEEFMKRRETAARI